MGGGRQGVRLGVLRAACCRVGRQAGVTMSGERADSGARQPAGELMSRDRGRAAERKTKSLLHAGLATVCACSLFSELGFGPGIT